MRTSKPLELEIYVPDDDFLQNKINSLFLDIIKHNLDNSNATQKEKISYIDGIIDSIKSGCS
ncbi:MAG: hypothetical protein ACI4WH_03130 [Oscillospiraceae bacterium]